MRYLLDTNVLSEPMKRNPNPAAIAWIARLESDFCICATSIEELCYGALRMPDGARKRGIRAAIDELVREYSADIIPFTTEDAIECGRLRAKAWGSGNNVAYQDIMIAAVAMRAGCVVATRNVRDFETLGVKTVNPFE